MTVLNNSLDDSRLCFFVVAVFPRDRLQAPFRSFLKYILRVISRIPIHQQQHHV
jgi:hypothetical protein